MRTANHGPPLALNWPERIAFSPAPLRRNTEKERSGRRQFENLIAKTGDGNRITYLKDVARIERGAQSYDQFNLKEGKPTSNIGIYQLPGANALEVAEQVRVTMDRLSATFP